jgi:N-acetylmuramoyl-L-alanine amidase
MSMYHRVEQGEHLSSIAKKYGFSTYKTIWDHPENAELKNNRKNPNVLFPGDWLFVPDGNEKSVSRSTEKRHRFLLRTQTLKLRLVLEDLYEKPIANAKCELQVENEDFKLVTNGQGRIEQDIKPEAKRALLIIKDPKTPVNEIEIPIKIGHLDPVEEVSGQKARLNNLGYFAGPFDGKTEAENQALFRSAIEEFQCDHFPEPRRADGVPSAVDGLCGPKTQAKLKQVHGS